MRWCNRQISGLNHVNIAPVIDGDKFQKQLGARLSLCLLAILASFQASCS